MKQIISLKPPILDHTGFLSMEIGKDSRGRRSIVKRVYHQGGIKVQRPVYLDNGDRPCYYILNPHGALLNDDLYKVNLTILEGAEMTLTTQGATIVYKCLTQEARQQIRVHLAENSYFEYLPGPIIGYPYAKFFQDVEIHMKANSTLMYLDVITPGWSPEGDEFCYDYLRLKSSVFREGELVIYDHIKLAPEEQEIKVLGYLEEYSHLGTFMVVSDKVDEETLEELYEILDRQEYDFKYGISRLSVPGFTIRFLANMTQHIERVTMECRNFLNKKWYDKNLRSLRKN